MNAPIHEHHLEPETSAPVSELAEFNLPPLAQVVDLLLGSDGIEIKDRQHHLRWYRACFVGSELIKFLADRLAIPRELALDLARQLEQAGHIRHVVGKHPVNDEYLFYRINRVLTTPIKTETLNRQQLAEIVQAMRDPSGLAFGVRYRWFVRYADCFTGREAVDWIAAYCEVPREQATKIGQSMLRGNFIRHLFDEHDFSDSPLLYRFV